MAEHPAAPGARPGAPRARLRVRKARFVPRSVRARSLLSGVLDALGRHREAIGQAEAVLAWRERVLGPDHPWTVGVGEKLARYRRSLAAAEPQERQGPAGPA